MRDRSRDESGYVLVLVAVLFSAVFLGMAAIGVDTARWYVEVERVQKAADAAALAGVTYLPNDLTNATATARAIASVNGYTNGVNATVTVTQGSRTSQLTVEIASTIKNSFGAAIGTPQITITRHATADYTGPAPMGSPCNIFGNEPPGQSQAPPLGTALPTPPFPNCNSHPFFWSAIYGPETDKVQGDRYSAISCSSSTFGCAAGKNTEIRPEGYFFAVKVETVAIGTPVTIQVYDPAYVRTGLDCSSLPSPSSNTPNPFANDALLRYARAGGIFCSGDTNGSSTSNPTVTSFAMREQTDSNNPMKGAPISGCTQQFVGTDTVPTANALNSTKGVYNQGLAKVFHQWVPLCTFTPSRAGDYYLQVRSNVSAGGLAEGNTNGNSPVAYSGNPAVVAALGNSTTGAGLNSFSLRAVPGDPAMGRHIAVSGWSRMPILQNAAASTARFNLIRVLPAAKGQNISFEFFDAADGAGSNGGTVHVLAPPDATGSLVSTGNVAGCQGALNNGSYGPLTACSVPVKGSTHNGQVQHMVIPIPPDYNCDPSTLGGCWFQVEITFTGNVTDFTTWDASLGGDPVRLIE